MSASAPEPAQWQHGWCSLAQRMPSPNFGPRPAGTAIDLLVLHSISLPPGEYGGPQIEQLFTNTLDFEAHPYFQSIRGLQVSAHFVVRRDGRVLRQAAPVSFYLRHASRLNLPPHPQPRPVLPGATLPPPTRQPVSLQPGVALEPKPGMPSTSPSPAAPKSGLLRRDTP